MRNLCCFLRSQLNKTSYFLRARFTLFLIKILFLLFPYICSTFTETFFFYYYYSDSYIPCSVIYFGIQVICRSPTIILLLFCKNASFIIDCFHNITKNFTISNIVYTFCLSTNDESTSTDRRNLCIKRKSKEIQIMIFQK